MKLQALLAQPRALPSAPKIATQLIDTLDDENADLPLLGRLIESDPVLTSKLMHQANSAFFGLLRQVTSPREALGMLGLTKVRAMALSALLQDGFHHTTGIDLEMFWRYSLTTANLARYIAAPLDIDDSAVYTVGLIHAIGQLVMHVGMPETMMRINNELSPFDVQRAQREQAHLGYSYAQVGAALAKQWRFPKRMVTALETQLNPFEGDNIEPIAAVVHLAAWRTKAEFSDMTYKDRVGSYPDDIGIALGVDPDMIVGDGISVLKNARTTSLM